MRSSGNSRGYVSGEDNERERPSSFTLSDLLARFAAALRLLSLAVLLRHTGHDRLVLEVETNGAISPLEAVVNIKLTST